ncbi:ankyrin repeat and SOCS box protein 8-like isoform X2 [Physella acuta]|uniref:ankyrin repeat and SOCS box protein 8-like isoform X2 n=1 Tax=Physella acuta TaxID=109671 RepID=UPI0027DBDF06|nr:ankyrin repeat and SOCS box protein 8-like isoform X2 [Physella acuta]
MWFVMEQVQEKYRLSDRLIRAISNWQLNDMDDDIHALIESGADVNRRHGTLLPLHCTCMVDDVDGYERTALHYAAERDEECVKVLLDHGADINKGDGNMDTALHWACYKNNPGCVRVLLEYGANINAVDYNNDTPLSWAARKGNFDSIKILLDYNADVDIRNLRGNTALQRSAGIQASGLNNEQDDASLELLIKASGQFDLLNDEGQPVPIIASDNRLSEILRPLCQTPRPLLDLCRRQIRRSIGPCYLPNVIPSLPVPTKLQEFLLLRDKKDILGVDGKPS